MKKCLVIAIMLLSYLGSGSVDQLYAAPAEKKPGVTTVKKVKKKKKAGSADYNFVNFLPFGAGQFRQGRYLTGGVLGGAQAGMILIYLERKSQVTASNKDANDTIAALEGGEPDDETLDYLSRNSAYVKKTNTEATLCLAGFGLFYGLSVVEAVWDPFGSRKAAVEKAKTVVEMDDGAAKWAEEAKLDRMQNRTKFGMLVNPGTANGSNTYGFTLEKSFR